MAPKIQMLCVNVDTNRWKSFFRNRMRVAAGDPGSFTIYGDPRLVQSEQMYAEHMAAESPTKTSGPWGDIEIWRLPTNRPDNHGWDCAVGCAALASVCGCRLPEWGKGAEMQKHSGEWFKAQGPRAKA
jgi:hypothetical protein